MIHSSFEAKCRYPSGPSYEKATVLPAAANQILSSGRPTPLPWLPVRDVARGVTNRSRFRPGTLLNCSRSQGRSSQRKARITSRRHLFRAGLVNFRLENADVGEVAVLLIEIQPVADYKLIWD